MLTEIHIVILSLLKDNLNENSIELKKQDTTETVSKYKIKTINPTVMPICCSLDENHENAHSPMGVQIAKGESHILQELKNETDESTTDQFHDGRHVVHFTINPSFFPGNFPVERDDPDEYYADKFSTSEAVDKVLLGGKCNESDEEVIALLDDMEDNN